MSSQQQRTNNYPKVPGSNDVAVVAIQSMPSLRSTSARLVQDTLLQYVRDDEKDADLDMAAMNDLTPPEWFGLMHALREQRSISHVDVSCLALLEGSSSGGKPSSQSRREDAKACLDALLAALQANSHITLLSTDNKAVEAAAAPILKQNRDTTRARQATMSDAAAHQETEKYAAMCVEEQAVLMDVESIQRATIDDEYQRSIESTVLLHEGRVADTAFKAAQTMQELTFLFHAKQLVYTACDERYVNYAVAYTKPFSKWKEQQESVNRSAIALAEDQKWKALRRRAFNNWERQRSKQRARERAETEAREHLLTEWFNIRMEIKNREQSQRHIFVTLRESMEDRAAQLEKHVANRVADDAKRHEQRMSDFETRQAYLAEKVKRERNRIDALFTNDRDKLLRNEMMLRYKIAQEEPMVFDLISELFQALATQAAARSDCGEAIRRRDAILQEQPNMCLTQPSPLASAHRQAAQHHHADGDHHHHRSSPFSAPLHLQQEVCTFPVQFIGQRRPQQVCPVASLALTMAEDWAKRAQDAVTYANTMLNRVKKNRPSFKAKEDFFLGEVKKLEDKFAMHFEFRPIISPFDLAVPSEQLFKMSPVASAEEHDMVSRKLVVWGGTIEARIAGDTPEEGLSADMDVDGSSSISLPWTTIDPGSPGKPSSATRSADKRMHITNFGPRTSVSEVSKAPSFVSAHFAAHGAIQVKDVQEVMRGVRVNVTASGQAQLPALLKCTVSVTLNLSHIRESVGALVCCKERYEMTKTIDAHVLVCKPIVSVPRGIPVSWAPGGGDCPAFSSIHVEAPPRAVFVNSLLHHRHESAGDEAGNDGHYEIEHNPQELFHDVTVHVRLGANSAPTDCLLLASDSSFHVEDIYEEEPAVVGMMSPVLMMRTESVVTTASSQHHDDNGGDSVLGMSFATGKTLARQESLHYLKKKESILHPPKSDGSSSTEQQEVSIRSAATSTRLAASTRRKRRKILVKRNLYFEECLIGEVVGNARLETLERLRKNQGFDFGFSCSHIVFRFAGKLALASRVRRFLTNICFFSRTDRPSIGKRELVFECFVDAPAAVPSEPTSSHQPFSAAVPPYRQCINTCDARAAIRVDSPPSSSAIRLVKSAVYGPSLTSGEVVAEHVSSMTPAPGKNLFSGVQVEDEDRVFFSGGYMRVYIASGAQLGDCLSVTTDHDPSLTIAPLTELDIEKGSVQVYSTHNPSLHHTVTGEEHFVVMYKHARVGVLTLQRSLATELARTLAAASATSGVGGGAAGSAKSTKKRKAKMTPQEQMQLSFPDHDADVPVTPQELILSFEDERSPIGRGSTESCAAILAGVVFSNNSVKPKVGDRDIRVELIAGPPSAPVTAAGDELTSIFANEDVEGEEANAHRHVRHAGSTILGCTTTQILRTNVLVRIGHSLLRAPLNTTSSKYLTNSGWKVLPPTEMPLQGRTASTDATGAAGGVTPAQAPLSKRPAPLESSILAGGGGGGVNVPSTNLCIRDDICRDFRGGHVELSIVDAFNPLIDFLAFNSPDEIAVLSSGADAFDVAVNFTREQHSPPANSKQHHSKTLQHSKPSATDAVGDDGQEADQQEAAAGETSPSVGGSRAATPRLTGDETGNSAWVSKSGTITILRRAKLVWRETGCEIGRMEYDEKLGVLSLFLPPLPELSKKRKSDQHDDATFTSFGVGNSSSVPEVNDDAPLPTGAVTRDMISSVLRSFQFLCSSPTEDNTSRGIRVTLCDGLQNVSHAFYKLFVFAIDEPSEVVLQCGKILHRHNIEPCAGGVQEPFFATPVAPVNEAFVEDDDTEFFDGGFLTAEFAAGASRGDTLRLMSVEQQRAQYFAAQLVPEKLIGQRGNRVVMDATGDVIATMTNVPSTEFGAHVQNLRFDFSENVFDFVPGKSTRQHTGNKSVVHISTVTAILNSIEFLCVTNDKVRAGIRQVKLSVGDGCNPAVGANTSTVAVLPPLVYGPVPCEMQYFVGGNQCIVGSKVMSYLARDECLSKGFIEARLVSPVHPTESLAFFTGATATSLSFELRAQTIVESDDGDEITASVFDNTGAFIGKLTSSRSHILVEFCGTQKQQAPPKVTAKQLDAVVHAFAFEVTDVSAESRRVEIRASDGSRPGCCNRFDVDIRMQQRK